MLLYPPQSARSGSSIWRPAKEVQVAPEVGLELTYGIMKIMSLRKLLKNLTKI